MDSRVVIVDDDPNILAAFKANVGRKFKVETFDNPFKALEQIREKGPYAVVMSDLRMPGMDGIKMLREVKNINPDTVRIVLTGHADLETCMAAVNEGYIFRFLTKPVDARILDMALDAGLEQYRLVAEIKEKNRTLEENLRAAAFIQERFLPKASPEVDNLEVYWKFLPCEYIGGDIFNVLKLDDHHVGVFMLDVSGHGAASALLAVSISEILQTRSRGQRNEEAVVAPVKVLESLDAEFPFDRFDKHFTIFYGIINTDTGHTSYSNAGHLPPIVLRSDGSMEKLEKGGTCIGLDGIVPLEEGTLTLNPGDKLVAYTDGVVEYASEDDSFFDIDALTDCLANHFAESPESIVETLFKEMMAFGDNRPPLDDIAILCIQRTGMVESRSR